MKYLKEKEKVKAFLNNNLIVRKGFDPIDIRDGINWDYKHSHNANTYQTYLHSLGIVTDLLKVSISESKPELQKLSLKIIIDWEKKNPTYKKNFSWKEHPVSSRINNLIEFQEKAEKYKIPNKTFQRIIKTHCEYLYNERYYKSNNHGLMMDYALLNASRFVEDKQEKNMYIDKAIYRVKYLLLRDFTRRGVHLENSPEYHRLVLTLIRKIENVLAKMKRNLGKDESELVKLAIQYKNFIIQPDQNYPMIGDTGTIIEPKTKKIFSDFVDYDAGLAILQNKNEERPKDSTMIVFKSGYHKLTHKHKDDLSYTLYMDGNELLMDSGKYSYNSKDPVRQHLVSPKGHSTIFFDKENYKLINPYKEQTKMKISRYINKPKYKMATGVNRLYENFNITRYNILTKSNFNIIIDRVVGKTSEKVHENFNFNESAKISKINDKRYEIELNDTTYILESFERYNTKVDSAIHTGYISREFGKYTENKRVVFTQDTQNATFITVLYNKNNINELKNIEIRAGKLECEIGEDKVTIDL